MKKVSVFLIHSVAPRILSVTRVIRCMTGGVFVKYQSFSFLIISWHVCFVSLSLQLFLGLFYNNCRPLLQFPTKIRIMVK